jgi:hypothetical protein
MPIRIFRSPLENWRGTNPMRGARAPGSKMPSVFELGSITDGRNDRGGRLGANALDGGNTPAWLIFEEYSIDLLVERGDTPIKVSEEIVKL